MMHFESLLLDLQAPLATITLNRPDKRNALNYAVVQELKQALKLLEAEPSIRVIILKGAGKAFCAGADLDYLQKLQQFGQAENLADSTHLMELFQLIYTLNRPVIAQVEGPALAGGCGLATVADFCFAVPEAKFGYTEVRIGFIPAIVMVFLLRKIGEGRARELLLTGDIINAEQAERWGLISRVVPAEDMEQTVQAFALRLATQNSPGAMEITKRMISDIQDLTLKEALNFAARMNARARETAECRQGISSFLNRQTPDWSAFGG
jgi:methylglutaconyl-CoA hydratase